MNSTASQRDAFRGWNADETVNAEVMLPQRLAGVLMFGTLRLEGGE